MGRNLSPYLSICIGLLLSFSGLYGQESKMEKADRYYQLLSYAKAIPIYEKVLKRKDVPAARIKLADCYHKIHDYEHAQGMYQLVVKYPGIDPVHLFQYATVLMSNEEYPKAVEWFTKYLELSDDEIKNSLARINMDMCHEIDSFLQRPSDYKIKNVESLNTEYSDFSPMYFGWGIAFSSSRQIDPTAALYGWDEQPYLNLFYAEKGSEGEFGEAGPLKGALQSNFHDGVSAWDSTSKTLFFTRNNLKNRKLKLSDERTAHLQLYSCIQQNGKWQAVEAFAFNSDEYSTGHPTLTQDGKTLYFVSDMPGGYGGTDLYFSQKEGESWTAPQNAGPQLNTPGNEMFPSMHPNGMLYYSSDGRGGVGGLDIYSARNEGGIWEIYHLQYPINSARDDFGLILDAELRKGYFSSNRKGGKGRDDMYSLALPWPPPEEFLPEESDTLPDTLVVQETSLTMESIPTLTQEIELPQRIELRGSVWEKYNKVIDNQHLLVTLLELASGEKRSFTPDDPALWSMDLKQNTEYEVIVEKEGYLVQRKPVSTQTEHELPVETVVFQLDPIELNTIISLENIYYDFDQSYIRKDAAEELIKWVGFLNDNPEIIVEFGSHTDCRGSDDYNHLLSQRRAKAAAEFFIEKGIDRNRITGKGYGEEVLANHCKDGVPCSKALHQENRRSEFKIVGILPAK